MTNNYNNVDTTIMSFYNKSSFLKVKSDGFGIDRLKFTFGSTDENKKLVSSVDFWLDFAKGDAYVFLQDIISGRLASEMDKEEKERLKKDPKNVYAQPIRIFQGGYSAENAKKKNVRTDGQAHAKVMTVAKGLKYPVCFTIEEGPGKESPEGLIVPNYKRNPETQIRVTLTWDSVKALALAVTAHHNAYLAIKYANMERELKKQRSQYNNTKRITPSIEEMADNIV